MGKLACRVGVFFMVLAAFVQVIVLFAPWHESIQQVVILPGIVYTYYLNSVKIQISSKTPLKILHAFEEFKPCGGQKYEQENGAWNKGSMDLKNELNIKTAKLEGTANQEDTNLIRSDIEKLKSDVQTLEQEEKQKLFKKYGSWCVTYPLHKVFMTLNNDLWSTLARYNPNLPLFNAAGYAIYFGGLFCTLLGNFMCLGFLLGAGFLYYYSEYKATKKARKLALTFISVSSVMGLMVMIISLFVLLLASQRTTAVPVVWLVLPRSVNLPVWGWKLQFMMLTVVSVILCFSKFWKLRHVEKLRIEKKNREREHDFFLAIGVNPTLSESDVSSFVSSTDDSDFSPEEAQQSSRSLKNDLSINSGRYPRESW